jgi:hypothetical protein
MPMSISLKGFTGKRERLPFELLWVLMQGSLYDFSKHIGFVQYHNHGKIQSEIICRHVQATFAKRDRPQSVYDI